MQLRLLIETGCDEVKAMFKLKIYCNDGETSQYWEDGVYTYETYDKALIACYESALSEAADLMMCSDQFSWFEVERNFEITEAYATDLLENVVFFPVATVYYDHAPWDRESDCEIKIVTGYAIVEM